MRESGSDNRARNACRNIAKQLLKDAHTPAERQEVTAAVREQCPHGDTLGLKCFLGSTMLVLPTESHVRDWIMEFVQRAAMTMSGACTEHGMDFSLHIAQRQSDKTLERARFYPAENWMTY